MKRIITIMCITLLLFGCKADTTSIQIRNQDGYIQYYDGTKWNNLISTNELKGEKGDKGDKGDAGTNGLNGTNGKNGINGTDGLNGTNGTNGKNGTDGKDATITQDYITKSFYVYIDYIDSNLDNCTDYGSLSISSLNKAIITN